MCVCMYLFIYNYIYIYQNISWNILKARAKQSCDFICCLVSKKCCLVFRLMGLPGTREVSSSVPARSWRSWSPHSFRGHQSGQVTAWKAPVQCKNHENSCKHIEKWYCRSSSYKIVVMTARWNRLELCSLGGFEYLRFLRWPEEFLIILRVLVLQVCIHVWVSVWLYKDIWIWEVTSENYESKM